MIRIRHGDWRAAIRPLEHDQGFGAIGDVHGQDDLYQALLDALETELADADRRTIVQLGDLVDRGPRSITALRRSKAGRSGVRLVTLMGNHEARMLSCISARDPDELQLWLGFGGLETIREVGVEPVEGWPERFAEALGPELVGWTASLPHLYRLDDYVFVHAGLDPAASLISQSRHTLIWTRQPWLSSAGPYAEGVAVVHGHTPQPFVDLGHPHRINLDTGAFQTGLLSGLVVIGDRMRLVQAAR